MRFLKRFVGLFRVLGRAKRNRLDLPRWLVRRPPLLAATALTEALLVTQNRVDHRLKVLAGTKAAAMVGCEYCLDISAALAKAEGLTPQHITDLPLEVSAIDSFPSVTDPSERSLTIVARVEVSLARLFGGQEQLCDILDRCADVSHHLLRHAPAWLGEE